MGMDEDAGPSPPPAAAAGRGRGSRAAGTIHNPAAVLICVICGLHATFCRPSKHGEGLDHDG
jgi:hypothetical protein